MCLLGGKNAYFIPLSPCKCSTSVSRQHACINYVIPLFGSLFPSLQTHMAVGSEKNWRTEPSQPITVLIPLQYIIYLECVHKLRVSVQTVYLFFIRGLILWVIRVRPTQSTNLHSAHCTAHMLHRKIIEVSRSQHKHNVTEKMESKYLFQNEFNLIML